MWVTDNDAFGIKDNQITPRTPAFAMFKDGLWIAASQ